MATRYSTLLRLRGCSLYWLILRSITFRVWRFPCSGCFGIAGIGALHQGCANFQQEGFKAWISLFHESRSEGRQGSLQRIFPDQVTKYINA